MCGSGVVLLMHRWQYHFMPTRGIIGFKCNGTYKIAMIPLATSPDGMGWDFAELVRKTNKNNDWNNLMKVCTDLKVLDGEELEKMGKKDKKLEKEVDLFNQWSFLPFNAKEKKFESLIDATITGKVKTWVDGSYFTKDSRWCEYGYVLNLDDQSLDLFRGNFNEPPPIGNPFGNELVEEEPPGVKTYPITLVKKVKFKDVPKKIPENWVSKIYGEDEEE